jgi:hypothetical protein
LDETGIYGGARGKDCRVAGVRGAIERVGKVDKEDLRRQRTWGNIRLNRTIAETRKQAGAASHFLRRNVFDQLELEHITKTTRDAFDPKR